MILSFKSHSPMFYKTSLTYKETFLASDQVKNTCIFNVFVFKRVQRVRVQMSGADRDSKFKMAVFMHRPL